MIMLWFLHTHTESQMQKAAAWLNIAQTTTAVIKCQIILRLIDSDTVIDNTQLN